MAVLGKKWRSVLMGALLIGAFSFLFLVLIEKNFRVTSEYLIVQNQGVGTQDFSSLSKSVEYTGKVMSEAIYSELFVNELVKTGKVNAEFLPFNQKDRLEAWSKMIRVQRNPQLGIIDVVVYDNSQREALAISDGINEVLNSESNLFRASSQEVEFRKISGPITEQNPTLTELIAAIGGGMLFGALLSLVLVYYRGEKKQHYVSVGSRPSVSRATAINPDDYLESLQYLDRK